MNSAKATSAGLPARSPSLAEIFFGRLANLWRKRREKRTFTRRRLQFQAIEPRILLSADLVFNADVDSADDTFTLRFNSDTGNLEVLDGATLAASQALVETTGVIINGEVNQGDRLIIDFGSGGFFAVPGGITFNGGTGVSDNDELVVTGGSFTTATHTFTMTGPEHSGNMVYDDGAGTTSMISYTGLEPIDMSGSTIENLVFNLPGTDDQAVLEDFGIAGDGFSQIRSQNAVPTFDVTTFVNPASSLTVNMGGDSGLFTVASLPDFDGSLAINGQGGSDNAVFAGLVNISSLSVTVGGSITIASTAGIVSNDGDMNLSAGGNLSINQALNAGEGDVRLISGAAVTQGVDGVITADELGIIADGSVTLPAGSHDVNTLAVMANGFVEFQDADDLTIGVVAAGGNAGFTGVAGIASNGSDVTLNVGNLAVNEALNAGIGDVRVMAGAAVTQAASGIVTADELGILTDGAVALAATRNDVNTLAVTSVGLIEFRDGDDLRIGVVAATATFAEVAGIVSNGSDVNLNVDSLEINQALDAGTGDVRLVVGANAINLHGAITADELGMVAGGDVLLAGSNSDVNILAIATSGIAAFLDVDDLTIGDVAAGGGAGFAGAVGITGDPINLFVDDALTIDSVLDSGTGSISLNAFGGVFFTEDAVLNIDLGGAAADQFTTVAISGNVTLGGTLDVEEVNGFTPTSGERFQFMTFASRAGFFDTINQPTQFYYVDQSDTDDLELVFDDTSPTVTINQAAAQADPTNAGTIRFTVMFSEEVLGFAADDVSLAGSTVGGLLNVSVVGSGALYTVSVTGMTSSGTVVASVEDDAAFDFANNLSDASTSTDNRVTFDNVAPTVKINQASGQADPTNASPISFTVLFSEAVVGFTAEDISFAGSTLSNLTASVTGNGAFYTVLVTGMNGVGTVVASVVDDAVTDLAGNLSSPSTSTDNMVTFDNVAPTVTIDQASGQPDPTNASPISFTVFFSEAVLGFDANDISFAGSTLSNLTANVTGSGANYTVTVTGMNGEGTVVASVVDDAATDLAGNLSFASTSTDNMVTFDNVAPTVTIDQASGQADPTNASPISFTVLFSEVVLGFDAGDISFAGSTLSNLTASVTGSGANYTVTVTVTGMDGMGTVVASVVDDAVFDFTGNLSDASTSTDNMVTFDNVAPTVTIDQASGQADPTNASPISFTVFFSEAVLGFDASDISFAGSTVGGTLTAMVTGSGASYTVSVTGMTSSGTVVASVIDDAATDLAGNLSFASTSTDNTVTFEAATGGIDLVGAVDWDPDDLLIPGDHEDVTVVVSNIGDTDVHQQVKVKLYASVDEVFDASDIFLDQRLTGSDIEAGSSSTAQFNLVFPGKLLPGEYFLLAVVDPSNDIAESNEANNTAIGESFDFHWMFGSVPDHGWETLTVRDADGTWVNFALVGPGTGEITIDEDGKWDLVVTGTTGSSILSILTLFGGDRRVELDDIHVTGALRGILAPKMDLTGTLAIDGALGAGMMIGSATDAVIAVETILGTCLYGLGVQGIAILGDLEDSEILIGADLGADGQLGGDGADADTYSGGDLGDLLITGSMISSCVRVGQGPGVDGIFDTADDVLLDGSIDSIKILGEMTEDSCFVASDLPWYARIDGERVYTECDPRFVDSLPESGGAGDPDCGIDWSANAGCGWGAGYSPFGSRAGQSNFSDFLVRLFG